MVDRVMTRLFVAILGLSCSAASGAQAMKDPTRPPPDLASVMPGAVVSASPLQSILISSGRKGAIISGTYVPLGGVYGDARLVNITATEVTLKGAQKSEVLRLYAGDARTSGVAEKQPGSANAGRRQ